MESVATATKAGYFFVNPLTIKVKKGLDRYRKDAGNIKDIAQSIQEYGQIQPIVINREGELIAGGRRLAACTLLQKEVKVIYEDIVDNLLMREWELEENLRRKDFTPAEEIIAVSEIHAMRQKKHGKTESGMDTGWSIEDTANIVGRSKTAVATDLQMADMIKQFPQLKDAKTKSEIKKAVKGLEKLTQAIGASNKHEEYLEKHKGVTLWSLLKEDSLEIMKKMEDGKVDLLLTDPLYGINADQVAITLGGQTGGMTGCGFKISDDAEEALGNLMTLAKESYRITKVNAHGYVFVAPEFFHIIRQMFIEAGWLVHIKPLIWIKGSTGQANMPYAWPSSCYEMLLYMRKTTSKLVIEGQPDWFQYPTVDSSKKIHQYEKPANLLRELIKRSVLPGSLVFDPFAGSCSTLEAATKEKCFSVGVEKSKEAYSLGLSRMVKVKEENTDEPAAN